LPVSDGIYNPKSHLAQRFNLFVTGAFHWRKETVLAKTSHWAKLRYCTLFRFQQ